MKQVEQRTLEMKKNFMTHRADGKGIYEIAEIYNLTPCTVYNHLQEIADEVGCEREELLRVPHPNYLRTAKGQKREVAEFHEVKELAGNVGKQIDGLLERLSIIN